MSIGDPQPPNDSSYILSLRISPDKQGKDLFVATKEIEQSRKSTEAFTQLLDRLSKKDLPNGLPAKALVDAFSDETLSGGGINLIIDQGIRTFQYGYKEVHLGSREEDGRTIAKIVQLSIPGNYHQEKVDYNDDDVLTMIAFCVGKHWQTIGDRFRTPVTGEIEDRTCEYKWIEGYNLRKIGD